MAPFGNKKEGDVSPVEQVLRNLGIKYERHLVQRSRCRWPKSNQIREVDPKKDVDRARAIAVAISQRGITPPPVVVSKNYVGIDGYGRNSAYEILGVDEIEAFRLTEDYDDNTIKQLQIQLNTVHGQRPSDTEMMGLIVHQRDVWGTEFTKLGEMFGLSDQKVSTLYYWEKLNQRLSALRQPTDGIQREAARELIKVKREPTLIEAARLAREAKMTVAQIKAMLADVDSANSDADEIMAIEKHRNDLNQQIVAGRMGHRIVQATNGLTMSKHLGAIGRTSASTLADVPAPKSEKHMAQMLQARDKLDAAIGILGAKKAA